METSLNHFILYCKGWYEITDNKFEDLKKILQLDDFIPSTESDVLSIVLNRYEKDFKDRLRLIDFITDLHPKNVWKIGYYTKGNNNWIKDNEKLSEYDYYTAVLYKIMSDYRFKELETKLTPPKYSKENPRPKNIELRRVIEIFNK